MRYWGQGFNVQILVEHSSVHHNTKLSIKEGNHSSVPYMLCSEAAVTPDVTETCHILPDSGQLGDKVSEECTKERKSMRM